MASKLWWNSFMLYLSITLFIVGITIIGLSFSKYPRKMWNRVKPKTSLSRDGQVGVSRRRLSMTDDYEGNDWQTRLGRLKADRSGKRVPNEYDILVQQSESLLKAQKNDLRLIGDKELLFETSILTKARVSKLKSEEFKLKLEELRDEHRRKAKEIKETKEILKSRRKDADEEMRNPRMPQHPVESEVGDFMYD